MSDVEEQEYTISFARGLPQNRAEVADRLLEHSVDAFTILREQTNCPVTPDWDFVSTSWAPTPDSYFEEFNFGIQAIHGHAQVKHSIKLLQKLMQAYLNEQKALHPREYGVSTPSYVPTSNGKRRRLHADSTN